MTLKEIVAAGLRKLNEKIDAVTKSVNERFDAAFKILQILNEAADDLEKDRDLDRARLSKLESILAGHEVALITLGADPQPVEDEVSAPPIKASVAENRANEPLASKDDCALQTIHEPPPEIESLQSGEIGGRRAA